MRPDLRGKFRGFLAGSVLIPSSILVPVLWKEEFNEAAPVPFRSCPLPNDGDEGINLLTSNNQHDTAYLGVDSLLSTFADGDPADLDDPRRNTASLLLRGVLRAFCRGLVKGTSQANLVDTAHPSPRFVEAQRDVPGSPATAPLPAIRRADRARGRRRDDQCRRHRVRRDRCRRADDRARGQWRGARAACRR